MDFKMSIILHLIPQVTNFNYTLEIKIKITLDDIKLQHVFANDQVLICVKAPFYSITKSCSCSIQIIFSA